MSALCVNCLVWHGSNTDNTLCGDFLPLGKVAHDALAALPEPERPPDWLDSDTWVAGFYAGYRAAVGLGRQPSHNASPSPVPHSPEERQ
jgi:hypothetical protein